MENNIPSIFLGTRLEILEKFSKLTDVKEIYTTKDSYVSLYFKKKGIKKIVFNKKNKQDIFKKIMRAQVKIVLSAGFPYIIPKKVLNKKRLYLNSHPSLLPKYKGYHAITDALMANEKSIGVTVHKMTSEVDSGKIIYQKSVLVQKKKLNEIYDLIFSKIEPEVISEAMRLVISNKKKWLV